MIPEEAVRFCSLCRRGEGPRDWSPKRENCFQCEAILKACAVEREGILRVLAADLAGNTLTRELLFAFASKMRGGKLGDCHLCGTLLDPDHICREIFP